MKTGWEGTDVAAGLAATLGAELMPMSDTLFNENVRFIFLNELMVGRAHDGGLATRLVLFAPIVPLLLMLLLLLLLQLLPVLPLLV